MNIAGDKDRIIGGGDGGDGDGGNEGDEDVSCREAFHRIFKRNFKILTLTPAAPFRPVLCRRKDQQLERRTTAVTAANKVDISPEVEKYAGVPASNHE
ncbi:hypothetical protein KQX54_019853 [Cotesia glomerata]|uniref:Uncharacterized protein n=1 Tax=Cotesia glomerata TaxID=32391 RepID=A0AAV7IJY8_COTGL|nr:hypothetical protein KQX54_019853 [Cotesia glomerata]